MKKVSIIVPIYNTSKYLDKCINSLINQTYKNLEILLIDDGSIDNSLEICNKYRLIDSRIKVYQKENGGVSNTRNYGLNKANGKYIIFLDSDDYIEIDAIECLINNYKKNYLIGLKIKKNNNVENIKNIYTPNELIKEVLNNKKMGNCWGYLFEKDKLNDIKFLENLYLAEDTLFLINYLKKIKKINYINKYYYYIDSINSITRSKNNLINKINSIIIFSNEIDKITNYSYSKYVTKKKIIMLEKELRFVDDYNEMKVIIKKIGNLKYFKFNIKYLIFCYLINNSHINLLLIYYKIRKIIKTILNLFLYCK